MKNVFNNWSNRKIFRLPPGTLHSTNSIITADFGHLERLYAAEETKPLRVAHKLNKTVLAPNNIQKTSPRHALGKSTEIFKLPVKILDVVKTCYGLLQVCNTTYLNAVILVFIIAVFDESTAEGLKLFGSGKWHGTAEFIDYICSIWKILNVRTTVKGVLVTSRILFVSCSGYKSNLVL